MPRLCVFTSSQTRLESALGRTPAKSALFFPSAIFDSHNTRWNNRDLAALVAHEMAKIYLHRGWSGTFVGIATSFINTLDDLQGSEHWGLRLIGKLLGPANFLFLLHRGVERSYAYEAAQVVMKIGRGLDYFKAIDTNVCPSLAKQPAPSYLNYDAAIKKRKPYKGILANFVRPITDWIDNLEWVEDGDKNDWRIVSLLDGLVREGKFYWQELNSNGPRTTRMKDYLRDELFIGKLPSFVSLLDSEMTLNDYLLSLTQTGPQDGLTYLDLKSLNGFSAKFKERLHFTLEEEIEPLMQTSLNHISPKQFDVFVQLVAQEELETLDRRDRKLNALLWLNEIERSDFDQKYSGVIRCSSTQSRFKLSNPSFYEQIGFYGDGTKPSYTRAEPRELLRYQEANNGCVANLFQQAVFFNNRNRRLESAIDELTQRVAELSEQIEQHRDNSQHRDAAQLAGSGRGHSRGRRGR